MNFNVTDHQTQLIADVRAFGLVELAPVAAQWDKTEQILRAQVQKSADFGLFGMTFPVEYGRRGLSALDA